MLTARAFAHAMENRMPLREFLSAFSQAERRIIAEALKRHADVLDALYEDAVAVDETKAEAGRIQVDAMIARNLFVSFAA